MAKVKIEVVKAVVNDKRHGETLTVEQNEADKLVALGYAKIVEEKPTKSTKAKAEA